MYLQNAPTKDGLENIYSLEGNSKMCDLKTKLYLLSSSYALTNVCKYKVQCVICFVHQLINNNVTTTRVRRFEHTHTLEYNMYQLACLLASSPYFIFSKVQTLLAPKSSARGELKSVAGEE